MNVHWGLPSGPVVLKLDARSPKGATLAFITEHRLIQFDIRPGEKWHHYTCDTYLEYGEQMRFVHNVGDQVAVDGIGFEVVESIEGPF